MKTMKKIFALALLVLGVASCEDTTFIERTAADPQAEITLDGQSVEGGNVAVEFQSSVTLKFTSSGVSYIKLETPLGWESTTSMDTKTIILTAPDYSDEYAEISGPVTIKIFDGTGKHIEKNFNVSAFECDLDFKIVSPDILSIINFSLGSKTWFVCDMTANVGSFNFSLPNGWKGEKSEQGFVVTAPVWTPESGFDQDGTITVTPVSYSGKTFEEKTASFNVHVDEKATFQFASPGTLTFNFGETQIIEFIAAGIKSIDECIAPEGWTVDYSGILDEGIIVVTAPEESRDLHGIGELKLKATQQGIEIPVESEGEVILRLRGVNSKEDLLAFREVHGATGDVVPDFTKLAPWLIDGELYFNTDIELGEDDMYSNKAYFIHHMYAAINGNGHTLTANFKGQAACLGLFQHVHKDVHDLNIAGSFELSNTSGTGVVAALGQQSTNADVTISNVNSSATVIFNGVSATNGSRAGGLLTKAQSNRTTRIVNCTVSGDIILNQCPNQAGGIIATGTDDGKNGTGLLSIEDCTFSGDIIYNAEGTSTAHYSSARIGGIIGSQERNGIIKDCAFTGNIEMYMGGKAMFTGTGGGIAGIMGRCNAETSGYVMHTEMSGCHAGGTITLHGTAGSEKTDNVHGLIGVNLGTCTPDGTCEDETVISIK